MDLHIRGHDIVVTDALHDYVMKRASKLDHLVDRVVEAKLELRKRHNRTGGDTTTAQLTIQTGRHILRAEENDRDPRVAVDRVIDKLTRQIRRFHDKRADRKGPRPEPVVAVEADEPTVTEPDVDLDGDDQAGLRGLVRTKRFSLKPMPVDEAIDQMELLGHDFYLFHNADEDQLNVVYRRRDGAYGLLAPSRR